MKIGTDQKMNLILKQSLLGTVVAWSALVLLMFVGTVFIQNEYIDNKSMPALGLIAGFSAVFFGLRISASLLRQENICGRVAATALYILSELSVAILFFNGVNSGVGVGILSTLLAALLAIFVGNKGKSRVRKRRRNAHTR